MHYLKLVRWTNLVILALLMAIVRLYIFEKGLQNSGVLFTLQFPESSFWILTLSVVLIAAGGNIVNDIYDQDIDKINKPEKRIIGVHIKENQAWIVYGILTLSGIVMGYYLALKQGDTSFALFHWVSALLLWIYASQMKKSPLIGNIIIALLAAAVPVLQLTFEYHSMHNEYAFILDMEGLANPLTFMMEWCFYLAVFAFLTTLIRELVKDVEDMEGDKRLGARTLPVIIGIDSVKRIASTLSIITIALLYFSLFYLSIFSQNKIIFLIYQSITIALLIGYAIMSLNKASAKNDFAKISTLWKLIMLAGFGTCVLYGLL